MMAKRWFSDLLRPTPNFLALVQCKRITAHHPQCIIARVKHGDGSIMLPSDAYRGHLKKLHPAEFHIVKSGLQLLR